MNNLTLSIIKPDAFEKAQDQLIATRITLAGFRVIGMHYTMLTKEKAEEFYSIHKDKPFFDDLIEFMTSGSILVYALEKDNAVKDFRKLIGDSDPKEADPGTIRHIYGTGMPNNAIHGSDSNENAKTEILFFFPELITKF
jgi:nucleoside-diphosphate kinase